MRAESLSLAPTAAIPNHPRFPALVYRGVVDGAGDAAAALEALFARNGWPPQWRDGIYPFHHYHTLGHEALGCACGPARVLLGGPDGARWRSPPATSRCCRPAPAIAGWRRARDFLVVGAYPPGQRADICRDAADARRCWRGSRGLPAPASDPAGRVRPGSSRSGAEALSRRAGGRARA